MADERGCNLLTAMEHIQVGESLTVAVTFVIDDDEPVLAVGRVFGATGMEMYRTMYDAKGGYRGTVLKVLDDIRHQWETNWSL